MTVTPATETPATLHRRPPTYFPGNDEDPSNADPGPNREFSFSDLLDVINPLQHIPVISTIYRAITGDTISPTANVMGSALFGGPVGALAAAATEMVSEMSGARPDEHLLAMFGEGDAPDRTDAQPETAMPEVSTAAKSAPEFRPPVDDTVQLGQDVLPPGPTVLYSALQASRASAGASQGMTQATGRDIGSYIAQSMPGVSRPPVLAVATALSAEAESGSLPAPVSVSPSTAPDTERDVARAAVAAAHARGVELLRRETGSSPAGAPAPVGGWFPDMMAQGLDRYRASSQLGAGTVAAAGPRG